MRHFVHLPSRRSSPATRSATGTEPPGRLDAARVLRSGGRVSGSSGLVGTALTYISSSASARSLRSRNACLLSRPSSLQA